MNNRLVAIMVWIGAETVLQIHGINFWNEHGGWQGWMWSVVLGVTTVWFWLHPSARIRITFGLLASLLLLAGPLWQVGSPLAIAAEQRYAQQQSVTLQLEALRNSETELTVTLQTYLRNSEQRTGWAPLISEVRENLNETRQSITTLAATPMVQRMAFLSVAVIVIQLSALLVLQVAAVAALLVLRNGATVAQRSVTQRVTVSATPLPAEANTIKMKITQGHYGDTPSMRQVMAGEGKRHPAVKKIFLDMLATGELVRDGQGVRLREG